MEEKDLISVIIPIYNVQDFLPSCVDSVLSQSYTNIEVILVDDGSPDGCGKICDEYKNKDSRVKVIHKMNGGLSDARNAGIENCNGEYLCFIDSDDIIHKDYIKCQYEQIMLTHSEMSVCLFSKFFEEDKIECAETENVDIQELDNNQLILKIFEKNNIHFISACTKLYKKSLFDNLRFEVGRLHEDEFIVFHIFSRCQKAVFVNAPLYFYRERPGSITMTKTYKEKNLDGFYSIQACYEFFVGTKYEQLALNRLINSIAYIYCAAKNRKADKKILKFLLDQYKKYYKSNKAKLLKQRLFFMFPNLIVKLKKLK